MSEQVRLLLTILQMEADEWFDSYQNREAPEDFLNGFAAAWNCIYGKVFEVYGDDTDCDTIKKYRYSINGKEVKLIGISRGIVSELRRI